MKTLPAAPTTAKYTLKLRFFDQQALIESDSNLHIELFGRMYRRFTVAEFLPAPEPPLKFAVLTRADNHWQQPVLVIEDDAWPLTDPQTLEGYVYEMILQTLITRVRSHFLIHAGVVAKNGQGLILAADSFHGKTTLVLELLRRGFSFLSDEMAAISRTDGLVHPFPRSLRARAGSLEMTGFGHLVSRSTVWFDKLLLDAADIRPNCIGRAAPIRHIITLQNPAAPTETPAADSPPKLGILVNRVDDALLHDLRQIPDVTRLATKTDRSYPLLMLRAHNRIAVLNQVEAICYAHKIMVLDVIKRFARRPNFKANAALSPVPTSQAVMALLQRFQGGHKSSLVQRDFDGNFTRLFLELATLIETARCHNLSVGPLAQMANRIEALIE